MACRKMNEYVAYARNTESGCKWTFPKGLKNKAKTWKKEEGMTTEKQKRD